MKDAPDGKCPCCDEPEFYGGECGYCGYGKECCDCGERRADREHTCASKWRCPINYAGCTRNCGSYGCGN